MDKQEIKSVWAAYLEVQEAKKKMDPVGQEDGDVDNDGDEDSSDEYLKNRRKKIGKAMKKDDEEEQKEGKIPPQFLKNVKKKKGEKDDKDDDDDADDVKESEESPYPSLDKKKREKKGSNLEPAGGPADKLKGAVGESKHEDEDDDDDDEKGKKVDCPKCKGKGCDHCDDKGYHMKEDFEYFVESLSDEELDEYIDWLNEEEQLDELSPELLNRASASARQKRADATATRGAEQKSRNYRYWRADRQKSFEKGMHHLDKADDHEKNRDAAAARAKKAKGQEKKFASAAAKKEGVESNMDRYVEALRSIPNDQIDELSDKTKSNYAAAVKKQNASGETDRKAQKTVKQAYKVGAKADAADAKATVHANNYKLHQRKADSGGSNSDMHAKLADKSKAKAMKGIDKAKSHGSHLNNISARSKKLANRKAMGETAYDIIGDVVERRNYARLADVLSGHELAAIEEKMKQPNDAAGKGEPFMSTNSAGEKKFYADHQKSNKDMTDKEEQGHDDVSKAGRAVKSQAATRRGEKRSGDLAMPTPTKAKGQ